MQPPHLGHAELLTSLRTLRMDVRTTQGGQVDCWVGLSQSKSADTNPISLSQRLGWVRELIWASCPGAKPITTYRTPVELLEAAATQFSSIWFVWGEDRMSQTTGLVQYTKKIEARTGCVIHVLGTPRTTGVTGTDLRALAREGNIQAFRTKIPGCLQADVPEMMQSITGHLPESVLWKESHMSKSLKDLRLQLLREAEDDTAVDREKERAKQEKDKLDTNIHTDEQRAKLADFTKKLATDDEKWRAAKERKDKGLKPLPPAPKAMKT